MTESTTMASTSHTTLPTPLGDLTLVARGGAMVGLYFPGHWYRPDTAAFGAESADGFDDVGRELREYFAGQRREFDVPLSAGGDGLQHKVWDLVRQVPYGETSTYGELARVLDDGTTPQEVGTAVGRNPLSIVVPCHRIVGSTGKLTGYAGGLRRKQYLLDLERETVGLDERDHMFHLAGLTPPSRRAGRHIRPGLISLAERLTDVPACIFTDLGEVLWQNALADVVLGDHDHHASRARNIVWRWFIEPASRAWFPEEDWPRHSLAHVSDLRATYSRRAGDDDVVELVHELLKRSTEFRELWERHEVAVHRFDRKRLLHPEVGVLHLTCEVLLAPEEDLKVLAFFPTEGTDAREKLELLRVVGTQNFETTL
jgi:O-6-methylguanine DNA methyltransferase